MYIIPSLEENKNATKQKTRQASITQHIALTMGGTSKEL